MSYIAFFYYFAIIVYRDVQKGVLLHTFSADFLSALIFTDLENVCPSFRSHLSKEDVYWVERAAEYQTLPFKEFAPLFAPK